MNTPMNQNELSEYPYVLPLDESNYLYSFQSSLRSFDIGVSRSFRNIISVKYPNLCQNQQHLRLFDREDRKSTRLNSSHRT